MSPVAFQSSCHRREFGGEGGITRDQSRVHLSYAGRSLWGSSSSAWPRAASPHSPAQRADEEVSPAWPGEFTKASLPFQEEQLPILRVAYPDLVDAEYVNDDELCLTCHTHIHGRDFADWPQPKCVDEVSRGARAVDRIRAQYD